MNTDYAYPASGVTDNQRRTYDHIQLFDAPLPDIPDRLPRMPDSNDTSRPFQDRARAYLAANCSMCHQPGGPAPTSMDLHWGIPSSQMNAINVRPGNGGLGIDNSFILSTRNPDQSILLYRMSLRDELFQMPPLATSRVDQDAVNLIRTWISRLGKVVPSIGILLLAN